MTDAEAEAALEFDRAVDVLIKYDIRVRLDERQHYELTTPYTSAGADLDGAIYFLNLDELPLRFGIA